MASPQSSQDLGVEAAALNFWKSLETWPVFAISSLKTISSPNSAVRDVTSFEEAL